MKKYYYPVFITLLGLVAVYAFYAFWHMPGATSDPSIKIPSKTPPKDLATKEMIPKTLSNTDDKDTGILPSSDINFQIEEEEGNSKEVGETANTPSLTQKQQQTQTESIYDSLTPEEHDETMEAASEAFEELDTAVETVDDQLAQEMEEAETNRVEEATANVEVESGKEPDTSEVDTTVTPSLQENDEDTDVTKEDVNNL